MKTSLGQAVIYCSLFVATVFINKYVLSILKFQYPTIFQGWQTLVGFLMLSLLITARHIPPMMENVTRSDIAHWLPGMMCFVATIYSGSKALAKLPIPVFMTMSNLTTVISCTGQLVMNRQLTSLYSYTMIMVLVITSILVATFDPNYSPEGYYWMCVHVIAAGALGIYNRLISGRLKLNDHEKLYCNYLYSVLLLAPFSYFNGDAVQAGKYPYLYFSKFYMGCIMSGVFGVFLSLSNTKLLEGCRDKEELTKVYGIAKLITSGLSLLFFDLELTASASFWMLFSHLAAIVCEDQSNVEEAPNLSAMIPSNIGLNKMNSVTHDYIKIPV